MKPFTPIRRPGPISKGRLKSALRGVAFELMEDRSCLRSVMPSPVLAVLVTEEGMTGASGSEGDEGYTRSCASQSAKVGI